MQTQTQYESEIKTVTRGDRTMTIENLTPILAPEERERRRKEIEKRLFDVFVKYAAKQKI